MKNVVGYSQVELMDDNNIPFPLSIMYPTDSEAKMERVGPFTLNVSLNATPKEVSAPLVIISHGSGGSGLTCRTIAYYLASHGFIVGMPEHPYNNKDDNSLEGTVENLINRPQLVTTVIDWFYEHSNFRNLLKEDEVAIIGHSMGGYTALAIAGGVPTNLPEGSVEQTAKPLSIAHDERVKALVLLAPAAIWFREEGALNEVSVPILLMVGEKDEYTGPECPILINSLKKEQFLPYGHHAKIILDGVPDKSKIQYRLIENAGHFSFLSPFSDNMKSKTFPPSQDPIGFDREKFHTEMNKAILDFIVSNLTGIL
jgi:predicted dienelactone hydrolase